MRILLAVAAGEKTVSPCVAEGKEAIVQVALFRYKIEKKCVLALDAESTETAHAILNPSYCGMEHSRSVYAFLCTIVSQFLRSHSVSHSVVYFHCRDRGSSNQRYFQSVEIRATTQTKQVAENNGILAKNSGILERKCSDSLNYAMKHIASLLFGPT